MPRQNSLRFAKKHLFRLLALVIISVFVTACGVATQANQNAPTVESQTVAGASPIVTEAATEIPVLEIAPSLTLPSSTEKPQVIQGELALFYLKEIYKDNVTGWWVNTSGYHAEYKFVNASGTVVTVKTDGVKFDSVGNVVTIFDDADNPLYVRRNGGWLGVTELDPATHLIRELNLDGRHVNWNAESHAWELSIPLSNEQIQQLGPHYKMVDGNLIYEGPEGSSEVLKLRTADRNLDVNTGDNGPMNFAPEQISASVVHGMDSRGEPLEAIIRISVPGAGALNEEVFVPGESGFRPTIDVLSGRSETEQANFPVVTFDEVANESLLYSALLHPFVYPDGVVPAEVPQLSVVATSYVSNEWELSIFNNNDFQMSIADLSNKVFYFNALNSPIQSAGKFRVLMPEGEGELPLMLQQYNFGNGRPYLFVPVGAGWPIKDGYLGIFDNPPSRVLFPAVSAKAGVTYCRVGGLGTVYDQSETICKIMGDGKNSPRDILPREMREKIASFDGGPQGSQKGNVFPVDGTWIYTLQRMVVPGIPDGVTLPDTFVHPSQ